MTFENLHADTDCQCAELSFLDTDNVFARKISKPILKNADFVSHWERNKRPVEPNCREVCKFKGVSVNLWNEETKEQIIVKYVDMLRFQAKMGVIKDCIMIFRCKQGAGVFSHSPNPYDKSHYTFFKSDDFNAEFVEVLFTIELNEYV